MNRCTGHCCETFFLPYSVEELRSFDWWRKGGQHRQVGGMALLLAPMTAAGGTRLDGHVGRCAERSADGWYYTCDNHDRETGNCRIYGDRPRMCASYPYGRRCRYPGCTWDDARDGCTPYEDGKILRADRSGNVFICHESAGIAPGRFLVPSVGDAWFTRAGELPEARMPDALIARLKAAEVIDRPRRTVRLWRRLPPSVRWFGEALVGRAAWALWRIRVEIQQDTLWMRTP